MKVLLTFMLLYAVCSANPLVGTGSSTSITGPSNVISPTSCRRPNSTYCGVNYAVPDVIATLVKVIEDKIQGQVESSVTDWMPGEELDDCQVAQKEILCAQEFPKCENENVILTSTSSCQEEIQENCPSASILLDNHFCGLEEAVVPLSTCSALSTFVSDNTLHHCGAIGENTRISEWMFRIIQFVDLKLSTSVDTFRTVGPSCIDNHVLYLCQTNGHCNEDSTQININNNYHFCESTINCYDNNIANGLRPLFPCEQWMNLDYAPSAQVDVTTTPLHTPAAPQATTKFSPPKMLSIDPKPITLPFDPFNGAHTLHSARHLLVCFIVSLVILMTLL